MAVNGDEIKFYLSTATSGPQSDPQASRGGNRSTTRLCHTESQLSAAMTAKDVAVDSSNSTTPSEYTGAWLLFVTGNLAGKCAKIASFDDVTGTFIFELPFEGLAASGDWYRVFVPEALFNDLGAQACGQGQTDYRMVYAYNESSPATGINDRRTYFELIDGGGLTFEMVTTGYNIEGIDYQPDIYTPPDLLPPWEISNYLSRWDESLCAGQGLSQPTYDDDWGSADRNAIWLRRIVPTATPAHDQYVVRVILLFSDMGGDPEPLESSFLIVFSADGFTPEIEIELDSAIRINGGCRATATVTVQETGNPAEDIPLEWEIDGPGTLYTPDDPVTDENGQGTAVYQSPTDQAEVGNTVTFKVSI